MASRSGLPKTRTNVVATALSVVALVVALVAGWGTSAVLAGASTLLWGVLLVMGIRRRRGRRQRQTFDAR
jgi:membrane associated rhomboid family serine protease